MNKREKFEKLGQKTDDLSINLDNWISIKEIQLIL